ncbi:hypothetical protein [Streptomyces rectiverticillatus]|uniref:hypothetical protein n=1 Tax=Streptomyces rectiverticillatus TaxID=173860 RepID=UPI001FEC28CB|nr:hypothetical protein [Streptomyces rectiverticillatus]
MHEDTAALQIAKRAEYADPLLRMSVWSMAKQFLVMLVMLAVIARIAWREAPRALAVFASLRVFVVGALALIAAPRWRGAVVVMRRAYASRHAWIDHARAVDVLTYPITPADATPELRVHGAGRVLVIRYPYPGAEKDALREVSLTIPPGKVALLSRNVQAWPALDPRAEIEMFESLHKLTGDGGTPPRPPGRRRSRTSEGDAHEDPELGQRARRPRRARTAPARELAAAGHLLAAGRRPGTGGDPACVRRA